jgi:hypothetical protein
LRDAFLNDLFRQMRIRLIRVPASWQYDPETNGTAQVPYLIQSHYDIYC